MNVGALEVSQPPCLHWSLPDNSTVGSQSYVVVPAALPNVRAAPRYRNLLTARAAIQARSTPPGLTDW